MDGNLTFKLETTGGIERCLRSLTLKSLLLPEKSMSKSILGPHELAEISDKRLQYYVHQLQ
jgi:hypothetical protein